MVNRMVKNPQILQGGVDGPVWARHLAKFRQNKKRALNLPNLT